MAYSKTANSLSGWIQRLKQQMVWNEGKNGREEIWADRWARPRVLNNNLNHLDCILKITKK